MQVERFESLNFLNFPGAPIKICTESAQKTGFLNAHIPLLDLSRFFTLGTERLLKSVFSTKENGGSAAQIVMTSNAGGGKRLRFE